MTHPGAKGAERGAYVLADGADALVIATGSEVSLAMEARELLAQRGISTRVVSMPCWEVFRAQDADYRASVLPPSITARVSVEAGVTMGWTEWIGAGVAIGIDRFGASAPGEELMANLGITARAVAEADERLRAKR